MTVLINTIRKVMGWCPNATMVKSKSSPMNDFANPSVKPSGKANADFFRTENIQFAPNSFLFVACFIIGLNFLFRVGSGLDFPVFLIILAAIYFSAYFILEKSFQAGIVINDSGVHLSSICMKTITLNYNGIVSVISNKRPIYSKRDSMALIIVGFVVLLALITYAAMRADWIVILSLVPVLPLCLITGQKQKKHSTNLNTQLYIEYKYKKLYKLSPYYSILTDDITASKIQSSINHFREAH